MIASWPEMLDKLSAISEEARFVTQMRQWHSRMFRVSNAILFFYLVRRPLSQKLLTPTSFVFQHAFDLTEVIILSLISSFYIWCLFVNVLFCQFCCQGGKSSIDERAAAAILADQMDKQLGGIATQVLTRMQWPVAYNYYLLQCLFTDWPIWKLIFLKIKTNTTDLIVTLS